MLAYKARMIVDYDSWKNSRDEIIIYEEIDKKAVCQVNDIRGWGQSTVEIDGEDYKILWLYIFINDWKTTPEYIEDIVMSACKALDIKEFISYTVDEIELLTENRITCFSFRNNQLCEKTQCEELFSYVSGNGSFMLDWVIKDNLNKKQNFELCKNTLHAADLNRELKKIYTNSKNKSNVENGSPVNYILQGYNTYGFKDSLEVLLSSLKDANRLSSNHVYKFSFDKLCEVHADYALYRYRDFEAFCDSLNDSLGASLNGNIVVIEYGLHDTDTNFDTQNYTAFQRFVNALKPYMEHTPVIFTIPDGNPDIVRRIHKLVDLPIADILIDRDFDPRGRSFTENYKYLKDKAHKQGIVPDEKLKTMLKTEMDDNTLENIDDLFFNWKTQKRIEDDYPQYIYEMQKVMKLKGQKEPDAMTRLDQLIGLGPVKKQIKDILTRIKMEKELKRQGLPVQEFSKHMVFLGNPGTGKTEVARLFGQFIKEANVLKEGRVLTISGANVHSNWDNIFARAKDNVLFIDEAYDLRENADNLASLVANLETHR
ncbi:MAG: AAA family ATPase, partial [Coriobacteriales bacterium]|nr:AAA family ATPase [Coriobacteriales bacterium]